MFSVSYSSKFLMELGNYPLNYQQAIVKFADTFTKHGFDFSQYKGKIKPSLYMIDKLHPNYDYAFKNRLWHYHLGLPEYKLSKYGMYHVSDVILHFSKISNTEIKILTITDHFKVTGEFWLPSEEYLV